MNKDTPKFLVNLTDDAGWSNAIEASADKLISTFIIFIFIL